jgi:Calcineurin-like phosphoesterase
MKKLVFVGDVHTKVKQFGQLLDKLLTPGALVFQLGDMGLGFGSTVLPKQPPQFRWIRGNHDDPAKCRAHPNYLGDYGYVLPLRLFYVAGAFSIDWEWRQEYMKVAGSPLWWPDEELSEIELGEAEVLYRKSKPEIMVSHECPSSVATALLLGLNVKGERAHSRTAQALQRMLEAHQPKHWVFGHYHVDRTMVLDGTVFRCCAELSPYELEVM